MLDNTSNQSSKFRTINWDKINDRSCETCNNNGQIKFKTFMIRLSLFAYSGASIQIKGNITIPSTEAAGAPAIIANKKVIFKR